ncbi:MAG: hypothetical protein A2Y54_03075 [Chloroflexi bacterium RBG_16_51_16]|nr:MAG: hypothetical protein A2Y54_03075 [Chloroflexi bacterium RBG_16_51_16]
MNFLLEPNVAYLVLLSGVVLSLLAIASPGTGLLEVGAFFMLALAGYAVYNLEFNAWALGLLILSVFPFIYALQKPKREGFLAVAILLLLGGSIFLFATESGLPAVNPFLAATASLLVTGFLWIAIRKSIQASLARPSHDLDSLTGTLGESKTRIHEEGSAQIAGELWSVRSEDPIAPGKTVRVVRREGFVLVVEKADSSNSDS